MNNFKLLLYNIKSFFNTMKSCEKHGHDWVITGKDYFSGEPDERICKRCYRREEGKRCPYDIDDYWQPSYSFFGSSQELKEKYAKEDIEKALSRNWKENN